MRKLQHHVSVFLYGNIGREGLQSIGATIGAELHKDKAWLVGAGDGSCSFTLLVLCFGLCPSFIFYSFVSRFLQTFFNWQIFKSKYHDKLMHDFLFSPCIA